MSTQETDRDHTGTKLWLNIAAVAGLALFLVLGFLALRHFSRESTGTPTGGTGANPIPRGENQPVAPGFVRPGEQAGRIIFADPDMADAEEFRALAERDPKAAASFIARLEDTPTRDERLYDLMQIWVVKDPAQAAGWIVGLPFSGLKNDATAELGLAWGKRDPRAAAKWVDENIFTENAPAGAASLTSAWVKIDIEAATEWVESLDADAPARSEAIKALAYHLGEIDPQRGKAWIARLKPHDRKLILVNFATSWSTAEPRAAANWLRFQAGGIDSGVRDQATLAVIHTWAANEKEAANASAWIDRLADGDLKENAKAAFAETHAETSPPEALPWARDINDPQRRLEVTMVVLEEWILQDKEGFRGEITDRWEAFDEPLRHQVYDLLLEHDPDFKKQLIDLFEGRGEEPDEPDEPDGVE
jgi:hypothetical protein